MMQNAKKYYIWLYIYIHTHMKLYFETIFHQFWKSKLKELNTQNI